jgi:hypothetical protein
MTSKKILVAVAFLLSATSVTLAQSRQYYSAPYGYGSYNDYGGAPYAYGPGYGPAYGYGSPYGYGDEDRAVNAQPSPSSGIESQR